MASFSSKTWKSRACKRFERAVANENPTAGAKLHRSLRSIESLDVLVEWCKSRKLTVTFGNVIGQYDDEKKTITINGRWLPETQLHILLHECGHHLIGARRPEQRFSEGYSTGGHDDNDTPHHRVDILEEEFEAWHRGRCLARRLNLNIDEKTWHNDRIQNLKTYMKWCLKVEGFGGKNGNKEKTKGP